MPAFHTGDQLANANEPFSPHPEVAITNAPLAVRQAYGELLKREAMRVAAYDQANSQRDQNRAAMHSAQNELANLEKVYARELTSDEYKKAYKVKSAEIKLFKNKLSADTAPKPIGADLETIDPIVVKRNGVFTAYTLPDGTVIEPTPGAYAAQQGKTKLLRVQRGKVIRMSRPPAETKKKISDVVDAIAKAGAPNLERLIFPDDVNDRSGRFEIRTQRTEIEWPNMVLNYGEITETRITNALAVLIWTDADRIKKKLFAMIDASVKEGISAEEKVQRVAEIHEQIAASLRVEHEIARACEREGNFLVRDQKYHWAVELGVEYADAAKIAEFI